METYLSLVAPRSEAPEKFHFWCGASAIAGVLRRHVYLPQGLFTWYPNLYILLIAPPGIAQKSTSIDTGLDMLKAIPDVVLGPDCSTWQQLITAVASSTVECLLTEINSPEPVLQPMSAITLGISEFGSFLDPKDYNMVNGLTDLYDCREKFDKQTKTSGNDFIINPCVNLIAGTTPDWMRDNFNTQFGGWGFSSRIIMLSEYRKSKVIPYPDALWGHKPVSQWMEEAGLIEDLKMMAALKGPYQMSTSAREYGTAWYTAHDQKRNDLTEARDTNPWLMYYLARKQAHMHKLAMVIAASRRNELIITCDDLRDSARHCDEVEIELVNIFRKLGVSRTQTDSKVSAVLDVIKFFFSKYNCPVPKEDLYPPLMREMTSQQMNDALDYLLKGNIIRIVAIQGKSMIELVAEDILADLGSPEASTGPRNVGSASELLQ